MFARRRIVVLTLLSCRGETEGLSLSSHNGVIFVARRLGGVEGDDCEGVRGKGGAKGEAGSILDLSKYINDNGSDSRVDRKVNLRRR